MTSLFFRNSEKKFKETEKVGENCAFYFYRMPECAVDIKNVMVPTGETITFEGKLTTKEIGVSYQDSGSSSSGSLIWSAGWRTGPGTLRGRAGVSA